MHSYLKKIWLSAVDNLETDRNDDDDNDEYDDDDCDDDDDVMMMRMGREGSL